MSKLRSGLERAFREKHPLPYETHRLPYTVRHHYTPDFILAENRFVETKGLFTSADRSKMLHVKQQHPEVKVLMVFQEPNRHLTKQSKTTYAQWCDKHDIRWLHINAAVRMTQEELQAFLNTGE